MSTPPTGFPMPGNPPPGGSYYGTPPPSNNSGCLKALGITCLTLLVLGIIGVIAMFSTVHKFMGTFKGVAQAQQDGQTIQQEIVAYHQKHGKYPKTLMSLVADGESDGRNFHSALDSNPSPAHVSWIYTPPPPGAPPNTPILELPYQMQIAGRSVPVPIEINLDGSVASSSNTRQTPGGGASPSNSP